MKAKKIFFDALKIGDKAFFEKKVVNNDVDAFALISGDYNPIHMDEQYAIHANFKNRVVHGFFIGSLVSRLVGMELPGQHALLIKESLEFKQPAYIGDKLFVSGVVVGKSQSTKIVELAVTIFRNKEILVSGSVHVKVLK